jgi:hypothetical protein
MCCTDIRTNCSFAFDEKYGISRSACLCDMSRCGVASGTNRRVSAASDNLTITLRKIAPILWLLNLAHSGSSFCTQNTVQVTDYSMFRFL